MFTERKSSSAQVYITYSIPSGSGFRSANGAGLLGNCGDPSLTAPSLQVEPCRVCRMCGGALRGRQAVCCSALCQRDYARSFPRRYRDNSGAQNGNWKGGVSRYPVRYTRAFKVANPEKVSAQRAVAQAIRSGRLIRPSACAACGQTCKPDAHHPDYALPMAVEWLCRKCHGTADRLRQAQDALKSASAQPEQASRGFHVSAKCGDLVGVRHARTLSTAAESQKRNSLARLSHTRSER
jgi:hypothetical protein